jgi:hypothetical protein
MGNEGLAEAPPGIMFIRGVSTSRKPRLSKKCLTYVTILDLVSERESEREREREGESKSVWYVYIYWFIYMYMCMCDACIRNFIRCIHLVYMHTIVNAWILSTTQAYHPSK